MVRDNLRVYLFLIFSSIFIFKLLDSPSDIILYIKNFTSLFSPFFIGIFLSLIINPIVIFFEKKLKFKKIISILLSVFIIFFMICLVIKLIFPAFSKTLNALYIEIPNFINLLSLNFDKYINFLPIVEENIKEIIYKYINIVSNLSSNNLITYFLNFTSTLFNLFMGVILCIYMLYEKDNIKINLKKLLLSLFEKETVDNIIEFFNVCHDIFYHYIIGKFIDSIIIGILAFLGFKFLIRIDNSLFLSFIIFITNIIPYFGPFVGAILPILMTFIYSPIKALWVLIFIILLQQLDGNLIGPKILGEQVGLSPLSIISSVLIGGSLFGVIGIFLSIPFAGVLKYLIKKYL